jgi:hypothetical protein
VDPVALDDGQQRGREDEERVHGSAADEELVQAGFRREVAVGA